MREGRTQDPDERMAAEQSLRGFSGNSEFIPQCQLILDSSKSEYALLLASNSLIKLFTKFYTTFTPQQTVEIRTAQLIGLPISTAI
jgi:exportin-7